MNASIHTCIFFKSPRHTDFDLPKQANSLNPNCLNSIRHQGSIGARNFGHGLYTCICADIPILLRVSARAKNKITSDGQRSPGSFPLLLSHFKFPLFFLVPRNEMPVFVSWLILSGTPQQANGFVWPAGRLAGIPQVDACSLDLLFLAG